MKETQPYEHGERTQHDDPATVSPNDVDIDIEPVVEKTEDELTVERLERQDVADEQAESIRQAEEEIQQELVQAGAEPVVAIRGLRKAFGDHEVLRGVDLHVN